MESYDSEQLRNLEEAATAVLHIDNKYKNNTMLYLFKVVLGKV